MRRMCYRCQKLEAMCLCARIHTVQNRTKIVILQHAHERAHALGTARIARLGLARLRLEVAHGRWHAGYEHSLALEHPSRCALLFPKPGARDLATLPAADRPDELLVLDGTWNQARRLYRDNPWLHELPHVSLTPQSPSRYRIRREPKPQYISTIEAIVSALRILEPELDGLDGLIDAFDSMIDDQIARSTHQPKVPRTRRVKRARKALLPEPFVTEPGRVVLVHGEAVQRDLRRDPRVPELLQWVALRPSTGAVFDRVAQQVRPPRAGHLETLGLPLDVMEAALDPSAMQDAWADFFEAGDQVVVWNTRVLPLLDRFLMRAGRTDGPAASRVLYAKSICSRLRGRSPGRLEDAVRAAALEPARDTTRARRRLADLEQIWRVLLARQRSSTSGVENPVQAARISS